ncbi:MAG: hypothetical protein ABF966_09765 [Bifidobacterium psychraerophilum]|uniref:hypothetical protein n=1 Tax=Bifidobacterium psychraerophilum TaxID=218140 RepID=UPI0039EA7B0C
MSDIGIKYVHAPIPVDTLNGTHLGKTIRITTPRGEEVQGTLTGIDTYQLSLGLQSSGEEVIHETNVTVTFGTLGSIHIPADSTALVKP